MNSVFQLKPIPERFMAYQLDIAELAEQLGSIDLIDELMQMGANDIPLSTIWKDGISSTFKPLSDTSSEVPDISLWDGSALILNAKAHAALHSYLEPEGEFLPVLADGIPMYIFNCLAYGKEDLTQCVRQYFDGVAVGVEHLKFDAADVANRFVFRSKMKGNNTLYCSGSFKALCQEFDLAGLRFDRDLVSPF